MSAWYAYEHGIPNGTIENCLNSGTIEGDVAGGIAIFHFYNDVAIEPSIINCVNKGEIKAYQVAGGIMGQAIGIMKNCINDGNVTADTSGINGGVYGIAGGICGWLYTQHSITTIYECTNNGNIVGSNRENANWTGGIVGERYRFARLDFGRNIT